MTKIGTKEMTSGPLLKPVIRYTIPIIISAVLQLLFNTADLMVVGIFGSEQSVGSVGATSSLTNLIVTFFLGLSVGAGVVVSQGLGAKDHRKVYQAVHTAIPVAVIGGVLVGVVGIVFAKPLLVWMDTPAENLRLSTVYMQIYFGGMIFNLLLNFGSSILRAAGDSTRPMLYLTVAGVVNVLLNLLFVIVFKMDVAGVALATILSQGVSAFLILRALCKREDACRLKLREMGIHRRPLGRMLAIGVPTGIQSALFSISNVLIQSSINSFGSVALTGSVAAGNLEGYVYVTMHGFNQTALNFSGQNTGARNYRRIRKIYWVCLALCAGVGLLGGGVVCLFAKPLLTLYGVHADEALDAAIIRLLFVCLPYFICGMQEIANGVVRGMGISLPPMIVTVLGVCGFRILWLYTVFAKHHTFGWLFVSYPISWFITFAAVSVIFFVALRRRMKMAS